MSGNRELTRRRFLKTTLTSSGIILANFNYRSIRVNDNYVTIFPEQYPSALRNPLMGLTGSGDHPYGTLGLDYIPWNKLEDKESDGIIKIQKYCDDSWKVYSSENRMVYPRIWLQYGNKFAWPEDINKGDYSSDRFKARVKRLIRRLGIVWDNDPRVAWIEMGIIGNWGEHHSPAPTQDMQKIMGDEFTAAFKNKIVLNRYPSQFRNYDFGIYWDSWAHPKEENNAKGIESQKDRWKRRIYEGQVAYNWGGIQEYIGYTPTDTMNNPDYYGRIINYSRRCHGTALSWISNYDYYDNATAEGAKCVQNAIGYKFVVTEVCYPARLKPQQVFTVSFKVRNTASAPFYYDWPLELSLLDPMDRSVKWKSIFQNNDIRDWLPGDDWDIDAQGFKKPAQLWPVTEKFRLPSDFPKGEYILALAILNPSGMKPSVRFAVKNYFSGGRFPVGYIGVDLLAQRTELTDIDFDDPQFDRTINYEGRANPTQ